MPYIRGDKRQLLRPKVDEIARLIKDPGDFTYVIYALAKAMVRAQGLSYSTLAMIEGCIVCSHKEFYRRVVAPYEDKKIQENGDVE